MSSKTGEGQVLAELRMIDHRHGDERHFLLRLTAGHLQLMADDEDTESNAHKPGFGSRVRALMGERGPMTPHALKDTDLRLDDNGVRIRMGKNATFSYADFDRREAQRFLMAYLQARQNVK